MDTRCFRKGVGGARHYFSPFEGSGGGNSLKRCRGVHTTRKSHARALLRNPSIFSPHNSKHLSSCSFAYLGGLEFLWDLPCVFIP